MVGMRFQFLLACLCALLSAANTSAQQSKPTQQQVLPDTFGNWHVTGCDVDLQKPALSQEAGEREFRQCQFTSGKLSTTIWAGKYRDPSGAYEVAVLARPDSCAQLAGSELALPKFAFPRFLREGRFLQIHIAAGDMPVAKGVGQDLLLCGFALLGGGVRGAQESA